MRYIKPQYYDAFQCLADKCPDTCCYGWKIQIDEVSLEKYAALKGDFGYRIKNSIDWLEETFVQVSNKCSLLNERKLCDLQSNLGEEFLCQTCGNYPRHVEEYDGLRELSLSLSCPAAAAMILECQEPNTLLEEVTGEEEVLWDEFGDFDSLLFTQLGDAREKLLQILQNRSHSFDYRLTRMLDMARQLQKCLEDSYCDMDSVIDRYAVEPDSTRNMDGNGSRREHKSRRWRMLKDSFMVFHKMERLREDWQQVLEDTWNTLYDCGEAQYLAVTDRFQRYCAEAGWTQVWETISENLMVFFIYTYFCGAVYDDWIYSKVALAAFSVSWIREFILAKWVLAEEKISRKDCIELSYRYAREVEHLDRNLNILEEWLVQHMGESQSDQSCT